LGCVLLFPLFNLLLALLISSFSQAGASEASLRFMFKNHVGVWTAPDGGSSIDVSTKVVTATTTHFGEWGVFGDVIISIISITADTDHAPFELADGTKLFIKGTEDAKVRPTFFLCHNIFAHHL